MGSKPNPAAYGHIAVLFRNFVKEQGSRTVAAKKLGVGVTGLDFWSSARGAPHQKRRPKLAKVLGCSVADLGRRSPVTYGEVKLLEGPAGSVKPKGSDVMKLTVRQDGTAVIELNMPLPYDKAFPIARMLFDQIALLQEEGVVE